jgi:CheY-like chemotaxis protein
MSKEPDLKSKASSKKESGSSLLFNVFKKKPKILMIEDDQDLNMLLKTTLQKQYNCKVDTATDPYEAMNCLSGKKYDLIVLDWQLPALNGGETLDEVEKGLALEKKSKTIEGDGKIPVLIFSGSPEKDCNFIATEHFERVGYVSKQKSLAEICNSFSQYFTFE